MRPENVFPDDAWDEPQMDWRVRNEHEERRRQEIVRKREGRLSSERR